MDSSVSGLRRRVRTKVGRYRLTVVGTDVPGVVEHAGGWLFDRCLAGWDVSVLLTRPSDPRPIHILGAAVLDAESMPAPGARGRLPHAIAVAASVLEGDDYARDLLTPALASGAVEAVMWGGASDLAISQYALTPSAHTLSIAARTFKSHALRAAGVPCTAAPTVEQFVSRPASTGSAGVDLGAAG